MPRRFSPAPALVAAGALVLGACAAPQAPYRTPDHWSKDGYQLPPGAATDAEVGDQGSHKTAVSRSRSSLRAKEGPRPEKAQSHPREPSPAVVSSDPVARVAPPEPTLAPMQKGRECLRDLRRSGVKYRSLSELKGVENPIEILDGRLGGVTFWANDGRPLEVDCRLALALSELAPVFKEYGLSRARFSGAYTYRRTRSGRLSHHAHGLAIDLHDLEFGDTTLSVEDDFARNVGCRKTNPTMNRIACAMRSRRLFEEFLDPDYNFDHRDHLHISVPRRKDS